MFGLLLFKGCAWKEGLDGMDLDICLEGLDGMNMDVGLEGLDGVELDVCFEELDRWILEGYGGREGGFGK